MTETTIANYITCNVIKSFYDNKIWGGRNKHSDEHPKVFHHSLVVVCCHKQGANSTKCCKKWYVNFFLNGPNPASFLFIFVLFSHRKDKYSTNLTILKKHWWHAWESKPGWHDGRRKRIHWAMAAPLKNCNVCLKRMI